MKARLRLRKRVVPTLALAACMVPLGISATALAQSQDLRSPDARDAAAGVSPQTQYVLPQDLRSPDARDAAAGISRTSSGVSQPSAAAPTVVIEHGTQTLAIVFASTALGIALAGAAFMLMAVYRRPRRAWSAPY
jgi:hypothetical protein